MCEIQGDSVLPADLRRPARRKIIILQALATVNRARNNLFTHVAQPTNPCVEKTLQMDGRSPDVRNDDGAIATGNPFDIAPSAGRYSFDAGFIISRRKYDRIAINSPDGQSFFAIAPSARSPSGNRCNSHHWEPHPRLLSRAPASLARRGEAKKVAESWESSHRASPFQLCAGCFHFNTRLSAERFRTPTA